MKKQIILCAVSLILATGFQAHAEETVVEKAQTGANKAGDGMKKAYRGAKDKVCEMVNGKMECVAKKMKHKMQNAGDAVETKVEEVKKQTN